jgi:hypothetical protein
MMAYFIAPRRRENVCAEGNLEAHLVNTVAIGVHLAEKRHGIPVALGGRL